jgi:hypothetical protein
MQESGHVPFETITEFVCRELEESLQTEFRMVGKYGQVLTGYKAEWKSASS